ncbi:unnamed protein product [Parnassius mnemosyne]|uniref:Uncharacterized protein n=1 Tax=Parnassius mnemosyne TaxID=213953 RepID=A0AAV1KWP1_9NEOP
MNPRVASIAAKRDTQRNYRSCSKAPRRKQRGSRSRPGCVGQASVPRSRLPTPKLTPSKVPTSSPQIATKAAPVTGAADQGANPLSPSVSKRLGETAGSCRLTTSAASPAPKTDAHPTRLIFSLVGGFISNVNIAELSSLARKLRVATSPQDKLNATINSYFLTILINRIPKSKLYYI